jgi:hypothetical protein
MWLWLTPSLLSTPHRVMALWCCILPRFIPLLPGFSIWVQSLPLCYTDRVECFLFAAFSHEWWLSQRCMHFSSFFGTPQNRHHFGFKNQNADKFWHHNKCQIMALIVLRGTNKHVRCKPWRICSFFCCSFVLQNRFFCFLVSLPILYFLSVSLLFICLCCSSVFVCLPVCVFVFTLTLLVVFSVTVLSSLRLQDSRCFVCPHPHSFWLSFHFSFNPVPSGDETSWVQGASRTKASQMVHGWCMIPGSGSRTSGKRNYCNRSSGKWCILHYF